MRFTNRQILKIAGPILVSVLMEHLIGMTDTAFLGRVGEVELGASALAGVYYLAIFMLGFGFSTGVQIMIGRRNGEGNYTAIGELFNQGFVFQFLLATFIFFATRFGSPLLLRHLIDSPQVYEATLEYMNRRIFGLFFSFTALMFRAFYVGIADTRTLTAISIWTMVQAFISISTWFLFFIAVEHLGERPLAITNVLRNISSLFFIIVSAFATTASSLVSNLMGSGDSGRVMDTFKKVSRLCYVFILPLIFVMALFPNSVMRIYTDNSALIQSAVPAYYVMIFVYLVSVPANILFNTVSGTGNTRSALFIELIALVAYVLSVIYLVIYLKADVAICWTTEYIYLVCMFSLTYWYMKKGNWKNKKI